MGSSQTEDQGDIDPNDLNESESESNGLHADCLDNTRNFNENGKIIINVFQPTALLSLPGENNKGIDLKSILI